MSAPTQGDLRVWYIPQIPMPAFNVDVPDLATAVLVLDALGKFSFFEFENKVKPDYADAGGVCRYEDGEWWDVDEDELDGAA